MFLNILFLGITKFCLETIEVELYTGVVQLLKSSFAVITTSFLNKGLIILWKHERMERHALGNTNIKVQPTLPGCIWFQDGFG